MPHLSVLVDFDNVDHALKAAGPVVCAKALVGRIPTEVSTIYERFRVRLYGGWRSNAQLTRGAQRLSPQIQADSPAQIAISGRKDPAPVVVELAEGPMGSSVKLSETLATDRGLRDFRARPEALRGCVEIANCGLSAYHGLSHAHPCRNESCGESLGKLLVRNEQKMVDTLIVADIAHEAFVSKVGHVVVVSSDSDIWPGILLSLGAGTSVIHIHPKKSWSTPGHLMRTLTATLSSRYFQLSI